MDESKHDAVSFTPKVISSVTVATDWEGPHGTEKRTSRKTLHTLCCTCSIKKLILLLLVLFVCVISLLMTRYLILPVAVDMFVSASTISLINATMSSPTATTIQLTTFVRVDNAGPLSATLSQFNASCGSHNAPFGWMIFPNVDLNGNAPTVVSFTTTLTISDNEGFGRNVVKTMKGERVDWQIRGKTVISLFGLNFDVIMDKTLAMPPTLLEDITAHELEPVSGNNTSGEAVFTAIGSMVSSSVLEIKDFGEADFEIWYDPVNMADTIVPSSILVGFFTMPSFEFERGHNDVPSIIKLVKSDNTTEAAISDMISRWASSKHHQVVIRGPVNHGSPFLNHLSTLPVMIQGGPNLFVGGAMNREHTAVGYNPYTGAPCSILEGKICMRGATVFGRNPFGKKLVLRDMVIDVFFEEQFSWDVDIVGIVSASPRIPLFSSSCKATDMFTRVVSRPGMHAHSPAYDNEYSSDPGMREWQRVRDDTIVMPANGQASMFLPGLPMPGQPEAQVRDGNTGGCFWGIEELDPFDCCYTTVFTAAACYYHTVKGLDFVPVKSRGDVTILIDDWSLSITHEPDDGMFLSFTDDILLFKQNLGPSAAAMGIPIDGLVEELGRVEVSCDGISFPNMPH